MTITFSLRWRLMLACILLITMTAGGMWWFSRKATIQSTVTIVESALNQFLELIEEEVRAGHSLTLQVETATLLFNHDYLEDEGRQIEATINLLIRQGVPKSILLKHFQEQAKIPLRTQTRFALYEKRGNDTVYDIINDKPLKKRGDNSVLSSYDIVTASDTEKKLTLFRDSEGDLAIGIFIPNQNSGWTIASYRKLAIAESDTTQISDAIITRVRQLISSVSVLNTGFLAAVDSDGVIQSIHKDKTLPEKILHAAADMDKQDTPRHISVELPEGRIEYRITPLQAFDWRLIIAVPTLELEAPADTLTEQLIKIAFAAILIGIIVAVLMFERIAGPLLRLAELARLLPSENILKANPIGFIRRLPIKRRDEVGELARSFSYMARELHRNVASLVEASAARETLQVELNVAREIQEGILPKKFPPYPERHDLDLYALNEPASEVGGDLYDFFFVGENRICLVIGDVSGKGVPAALYMSITVTLVRASMQVPGTTPAEALERVNFNLASDNTKGMFVTLFIGVLDLTDGTLTWASGGHPPPIILRGNIIERLKPTGDLVVGALPDIHYSLHSLRLEPGEALFCYSDGVSEAMNKHLEPYGEARLQTILPYLAPLGMQQLIEAVRADIAVQIQGAPVSDDITMLALRYKPTTPRTLHTAS